jgi:membrane protein implicated in regulation of membrane protease activity
MDLNDLIGCCGTLTLATRGPAGFGEITVKAHGCRMAYLAWSAEPIARGEQVVVIGIRGIGTVMVEPWDFGARAPEG